MGVLSAHRLSAIENALIAPSDSLHFYFFFSLNQFPVNQISQALRFRTLGDFILEPILNMYSLFIFNEQRLKRNSNLFFF